MIRINTGADLTGDWTDYTDADRDEAYVATHPNCLICGKGCCGSSICACGPTPIPLDAKALDVACSAECVSEYEKGDQTEMDYDPDEDRTP